MAERPSAPPDPPLSDGVVTLRQWREMDVPALVAVLNGDSEIVRWLDRLPQPYTARDAREYVEFAERGWRGDHLGETPLAIADAATNEPLGSLGLRWTPEEAVAEVGYWTGRPFRGRGVATRAVRLAAGWVLGDLGYERLELEADPRNGASLGVAERAGFTCEGILRSVHRDARTGERVDHALYALLRTAR
jgi:RimJ/RimL family protein N-acetyltransferase